MVTRSCQFNPLTANALDLQELLRQGKTTSVGIVEEHLSQIDQHESTLNSFIAIAPRNDLLRSAAAFDEERSRGSVRSPLHGIPIVLKVRTVCVIESQTLRFWHSSP